MRALDRSIRFPPDESGCLIASLTATLEEPDSKKTEMAVKQFGRIILWILCAVLGAQAIRAFLVFAGAVSNHQPFSATAGTLTACLFCLTMATVCAVAAQRMKEKSDPTTGRV